MNKKISFSQLEIFNTCPYSWYISYVLKKWSPGNPFSCFGTAMHTLLERVYREQIFEPQPYIELWKETLRKEYLNGRYPTFEKSMMDWQISRGYPMIHNFFKVAKENDLLKPAIATEQRLTGTFGDYKVVGILDLIHILNNKRTVIDYKTGKKESDSHKLQLTLYKELKNAQLKEHKIEQCAVWYLGSKTLKIIEPDRKATALFIKNTVAEMEKMIATGKFEKRKNEWCKECLGNIEGMCSKDERITQILKRKNTQGKK
jgi:RecB family exonuclease